MDQKQQNLSDEDFFANYCTLADIVYNNGEEEAVFIKDKDLVFRYVSMEYLARFFPKGSTLTDVQNEVPQTDEEREILEVIRVQDELVRTTMETRKYLYVDKYDHVIMTHESPIINPATGNFVGLLGMANTFILPHILDLIYKINGTIFGLTTKTQSEPLKYKLTKRQHVVLFLSLNNYSYSEIASIMTTLGLTISPGRVNAHLEKLKAIFNVLSKEQLIEKAILLKYHRFIPRDLLKNGSYDINDVMIIAD